MVVTLGAGQWSKMKIAILGTRGIPNNYGGSEQNAEHLSKYFCEMGHEVVVYSPDDHPYDEQSYGPVSIRRIFCHEKWLKIVGTFLYDMLCMLDARRRDYDIILQLGNVPAAAFYFLKSSRYILVTNMDGLEWKRGKWNRVLQAFAKYCETNGARRSDGLIADNLAIRDYLKQEYDVDSRFISYGAEILKPEETALLQQYQLTEREYYCLIARLEPENNIELILDGYLESGSEMDFIVIGKTTTPHAALLLRKYKEQPRIRFLGGIYDYKNLSHLRGLARLYFHGHSVGGTNPSLLEAMATGAYIAAHKNPFNQTVLGDNAKYFSEVEDVSQIIRAYSDAERELATAANYTVIEKEHRWDNLARKHLDYFSELIAAKAAI